MHTHVDLKCPEREQGSWVATVRVYEDGRAEVLGYGDTAQQALHEALENEREANEA